MDIQLIAEARHMQRSLGITVRREDGSVFYAQFDKDMHKEELQELMEVLLLLGIQPKK
jgi:hypothetical protein